MTLKVGSTGGYAEHRSARQVDRAAGVMMEVRWGFVGAGNVTEAKAAPAGAFTQDGSRVVAVARSDKGRAEQYARANGIARAYASVEELCADPDVNAVYVCTPHHLHRDHALAAIRAG